MYRSRRIQASSSSKRTRSRSASVAPRKKYPKKAVVKSSYAGVLSSLSGVGLGPSLQTQVKTVFVTTLTTNATGFLGARIKTGSCFDPTGDLSTVQPIEFDQLAALYGRYCVTGGTLKVSVAGINTEPFSVGIYPTTETTWKSSFWSSAGQDFSIVKQGDVTNPIRFYQKFSHAALLGKKGPVNPEDNGAATTADPTSGQFISHMIVIQSANVAEATSYSILVELIQDVYFDRKIATSDA